MLNPRWRALLGATLLAAPLLAATPAQAADAVLDQQVAVPAYFLPGNTPDYWNQLNTMTGKPGVVVANVANGPGNLAKPAYTSALSAAHAAGMKVIGYVDTGYFGTTGLAANRTRLGSPAVEDWRAQIQSDINKWYEFYGSSIDGIFFDQAQNACGPATGSETWVSLYREATAYVKAYHPGATTIANPGVSPAACYQDAADILVTFEGSYSSYQNRQAPYLPSAWEATADPKRIWHLVYDVPDAAAMATVIATSKADNAGYVYVTDDKLDNPWDTLPSYLSSQVTAAKGSGGAAPAKPATPAASLVKATSARLSWASAAYPGVVGYDVYQGSVKIGGTANLTPSATAFDVGGLTAATAYSFTVKARDRAGNVSAASTALAVTTAAASASAPTVPGKPVASNVGPTSVKLTWTASADSDSGDSVAFYDVFRNGVRELSLPGGLTSVNLGGLALNTSYGFTVRARDTTGRASAQTAATTITTTDPVPVTGAAAAMDENNATYQAQFNLPYSGHHVFIDTDADYQTGWSVNTIGAEYMIENNALFQKTGDPGQWTWTAVPGVTPLVSDAGGLYKWSVPSWLLTGAGLTHKIVFHGTDGDRNDYAANVLTVTAPSTPVAPIAGAVAAVSADSATYTAKFNLPYTTYHVFIDTDANYQTGWSVNTIGAEYMIENNLLFKKTGASADWAWSQVAGVSPLVSSTDGLYKWSVPLSQLTGTGNVQKIVFHATDGTRNDYAPSVISLTTS
ncbi:fibronectin type III domain-containing protein [Actinomadura sp. ATCC 31491]|uniref:Fibronectin type III domain-containing protein n=1 Tax=Actinomadura luzonensis TaxID=2805427 RepID=A0ABT0G3M1_9ACTN|nr:spherulation-specific family 4 protein [Actinomadura luzonensis]MCK2218728.1 fibronectin type III domain-containing protein [Actinomadura luzonensis]